MKRAIAVVAVVAAVFGNLWAQEEKTQAAAKVKIENILPQKTLLLVKINDVAKYNEKAKETITYRIFDYFTSPEFAEVLKSNGARSEETFGEAEKKFKEETGMTFKELADLPSGEVALAITSFTREGNSPLYHLPKIEMVLHCGLSDTEKVRSMIEKAEKKTQALETYEMGKDKVWFKTDKDASVYFTLTDDLGFVLTIGEKDYFESMIALFRGEKKEGAVLADSAVYKNVARQLDTGKADYIGYLDLRKLTTVILQRGIIGDIAKEKETLDSIGVMSIKAIGLAGQIDEKGRSKDSIYIYAPGEKEGLMKALANGTTNREEGIMLSNEGDYGFFMGGTGGIAIAAAMAIPSLLGVKKYPKEGSAQKMMANIAQIEGIWYKQDTDRNGQHDFWTYDYSGFYYAQNAGGNLNAMIDIASGNSDPEVIKHWATLSTAANGGAALAKATPRNGYYVAAIELDPSGEPYCQNAIGNSTLGSDTIEKGQTKTCNTNEYGFCAYPAEYGKTGTMTFIVDQTCAIYQKDTGGKPITNWKTQVAGTGLSPVTNGWALSDY